MRLTTTHCFEFDRTLFNAQTIKKAEKFLCDTFPEITKEHFDRIQLKNASIGIRLKNVPLIGTVLGAEAEYDPKTNTLYLDPQDSDLPESIVHETIHALCDLGVFNKGSDQFMAEAVELYYYVFRGFELEFDRKEKHNIDQGRDYFTTRGLSPYVIQINIVQQERKSRNKDATDLGEFIHGICMTMLEHGYKRKSVHLFLTRLLHGELLEESLKGIPSLHVRS